MDLRDLGKIAFLSNGELDYNITTYSAKQRGYFEENTGVGNPTDLRNLAKTQSLDSIFRITYLLENSQFLESREEQWFDKVFNAHTLQPILQNLIKDIGKPKILRDYRSDFKTIELARMYFEVSMMYLKYVTKDSKILHDDIERISERYREIAHTALENEAHKRHGNEETKTITEKNEEKLVKNLHNTLKERSRWYSTEEFLSLYKERTNLRWDLTSAETQYRQKNNFKPL